MAKPRGRSRDVTTAICKRILKMVRRERGNTAGPTAKNGKPFVIEHRYPRRRSLA